MVLNPALYRALQAKFGTVRVSAHGQRLTFEVKPGKNGDQEIVKTGPSEQYSVCCPFCGDTRYRLTINHAWLTSPVRGVPMITKFAKCYNEGCNVTNPEFYKQFVGPTEQFAGLLDLMATAEPPPLLEVRMPKGCVALHELPAHHAVHSFLVQKYNGLTAEYLGKFYGATFTSEYDELYRLASNRIIFPIMKAGKLVGWQGRSVSPDEKRRWVLSPGFRKTLYNADRLHYGQIPIICEGITSAIACGPTGIAIFGKSMDDHLCQELAARFPTAIVAVDAETFVPDIRTEKRDPHGVVVAPAREYAKELCDRLNRYCKIPVYPIVWPGSVMELARQKVAGQDVKVPDAADLGISAMHALLETQIPPSHRGLI